MRSRGGGGDALLKNFNLTNCGPCYGLLGRRLHIAKAGVGGGGGRGEGGGGLVVDTPLFGLHGYESLNRVWFSGSGIFLLFCTTSL